MGKGVSSLTEHLLLGTRLPTSRTIECWEIGCRDCTTFNWKGMRITSSDPTADSRTFTVNPEIAANFCNAHCPRGISEIMTGSFPRSRLFGTNLPAIRKDAYACQTGYSAYASLWENAEDGLCSESAPLPSRSIRSIRPSAVI